jgi:hypothetical protein
MTGRLIYAVSFMRCVRLFAIARKLPFFTWNEQTAARQLYIEHAMQNN